MATSILKPPRLTLKGLEECDSPLLRRRGTGSQRQIDSQTGSATSLTHDTPPNKSHYSNIMYNPTNSDYSNINNNNDEPEFKGPFCHLCKEPCDKEQETVMCNVGVEEGGGGETWHPSCFVCAQCFQPFKDGVFYEFEGRKYCEHDFNTLFAPCCGRCKQFITGRVIRAMNASWHPDCFRCHVCAKTLADEGFVRHGGRAVCRGCNLRERASGLGRYICYKCHMIIDEPVLKYKGETFHPYHFSCSLCKVELTSQARDIGGELLCLRCHDKKGVPICGACRRPIEERVVHALGKTWHVEHFVCNRCEKPFLGTRHYEKKGLAYCELHYHQLYGNICFVCNGIVSGDVLSALNKSWCTQHFSCSFCDTSLTKKSKFYELDLRPVCKTCYGHFPSELRKRLKKSYDAQSNATSPTPKSSGAGGSLQRRPSWRRK